VAHVHRKRLVLSRTTILCKLHNKYNPSTVTFNTLTLSIELRTDVSLTVFVYRLHLQLLQLNDMHPVRPVSSLGGTRVGDRLVYPAHELEHDVILLEREFLLDFDTLDQLL
jgi:hypothetical protein